MTRWSSQAPRKTRRRIQWTRLRLAGPTRSSQFSLMCSPRRGAGLGDLAADGEVEEVVELLLAESLVDEAELDRGLLDPLPEVLLVEGEAELPVLEYVVGARLVVPSAGRFLIHVS